MTKYKTKNQYLQDLEFPLGTVEYSNEQIKSQYRKLSIKYHPDNLAQGNEEKFKIISVAYTCLVEKKYEEPDLLNSELSVEKTFETISSTFFSLLKKTSKTININNKKVDKQLLIMDNKILILDWSELTQEKILVLMKFGLIIQFVKE